ncbi:unnamed protein product [Boreogadus saida]
MPFEAETVNGAHCDITAWVGNITGTLAAESVPPRPSSDASDLQDLTRTYSQAYSRSHRVNVSSVRL